MKYFILLLLSLAGWMNACQCQQDSITFMHAPWEEHVIARGVRLLQCRFDHSLFGASQNISVLEIKMDRKNRIDVEADSSRLLPTSSFGLNHGALAAVNGTFFDMKNGGSVDYIRLDGKRLNATRTNNNHVRAFHQRSAIVSTGKRISIQQWDGSADWEDKLTGEDVMVTGPLLLSRHRRMPLDTTSFYTARHPRSAIGIKGNKVLLVTVDGRNQRAAGMNLTELASIFKWLDATDAVNLDGGGSTTLWIDHFPDGGVINYPSDNKKMEKSAQYKAGTDLDNMAADEQKWDHTGQRRVANVILVNKKK